MTESPSSNGEAFLVADFSSLELPSPTMSVPDEEYDLGQYLAYVREMERFRAHYSGIHGAMLLFQSGLAMVIAIFLSCIAWWKADEGVTGDDSGNTYVYMICLTPFFDLTGSILIPWWMLTNVSSRLQIVRLSAAILVLILSFTTFLIHAIYLLSQRVLLCLQTAILLSTILSATLMGVESMKEDNTALKFILASSSILFGVMSALAFVLAAVAWKVMGFYKKKARRWYELTTD